MLPTARPVISGLADADQHVPRRPSRWPACRAGCRPCPPTAYSPTKQSAATGTETSAATAAAGATSESRLGSTACRPRKTSQPTTTVDQAHQVDVGAERGDPAVGEEQACTRNTTLMHSTRGARPDQHGGERAAEQVAAGAGADREVQHLGGEDEGGDQAGHRRGPVVELAAGAAQGHARPRPRRPRRWRRRSGRRGSRRGRACRASLYVEHRPVAPGSVAQATLLHMMCNKHLSVRPGRTRP